MRAVGLILVCLGAIVLGSHGFGGREGKAGPVSPLTGGIALVSGLLLLTAGGRRRVEGNG